MVSSLNNFEIKQSVTLKVKAFKNGFEASYTAAVKFRKLDLMPALKVNKIEQGIAYEYREVWVCKTVNDITRYPLKQQGILATVKADPGIGISQKIGIIYRGYIKAPMGVYTFFLDSDDGSALTIDGIEVVNNDGSHRRRERSGKIALAKGLHRITVKHFQVGGRAKLTVSWQGPGIKKQVIQGKYFFH